MGLMIGGTPMPNSARAVLPLVATPAAPTATNALAAQTLPATGTTTVTTGITQPDTPRNLTIVGNAAGITGNVVVTGTNADGSTITETLAANATTPVVGSKAFASITSVVFPTRNAGSNTISVGFGSKLGLPVRSALNTVLMAFLNGVREGTAPTVTTSGTAVESNTVTLNSSLDGSAVVVYYIA